MSASGSASAIYMCFGSVAGEAQAPGQMSKAPASGGWMSLESCSFQGSMNFGQRAAEQMKGGGDISDVRVTKVTDASSPGLLRLALLGDFSHAAVIVFLRTGGGAQEEYLRLELRDCGITSCQIDSLDGERSIETYTIRFATLDINSFLFDTRGQRSKISQSIFNQA